MSDTERADWEATAAERTLFARGQRYLAPAGTRGLFTTSERVKGRHVESTYVTLVTGAYVTWSWTWIGDTAAWAWRVITFETILNPRTGEPYKSGWREGTVRNSHTATTDKPGGHMLALLAERTNPHTIITITEEPAA